MTRDLLPEELVQSLLQQAVVRILQSHGYTSIQPRALNLLIDTVEKRLLGLLRRASSMANTQRRTIPSPTDLQYAFLIENIHTSHLEDEISRFPHPPLLHPQIEPPHRALEPSQVDQQIYTKAILPAQLRPQSNTPEYVPGTFPLFPPKYTWSYTPSYVPRAVDPEVIRRKAAQERELVERSLARLVQREEREGRSERERDTGERGERERVWWDTWREMGCDLDSLTEVWPVPKLRREVGPGM